MKKTLLLICLLIIIILYGCNTLSDGKVKEFIKDRNNNVSRNNLPLVLPFTLKIAKLIQNNRTTYRFEIISEGKDIMKYHIEDFNDWLVKKGYFISEGIHSKDLDHSYAVDPYIYYYGNITQKGYDYFTSNKYIFPQTNVGGIYTAFAFTFTAFDEPIVMDIQKKDKNARVTYFNKYKWNESDYVNELKEKFASLQIPNTKQVFMDIVKYDDGWRYVR